MERSNILGLFYLYNLAYVLHVCTLNFMKITLKYVTDLEYTRINAHTCTWSPCILCGQIEKWQCN